MLNIIQITDTHIFTDPNAELYGVNTRRSLSAVMQHINQSKVTPDMVWLTGDLSHDETESSYRVLDSMLQQWNVPKYCIPGNHDAPTFMENVFPPEPSDFPVDMGIGIAEWEQNFTERVRKEIKKADYRVAIEGLSVMDLPPYNCQSPMMMPMMQKLFNIPSDFVKMENFVMYDKEGNPYRPSEGELPAS